MHTQVSIFCQSTADTFHSDAEVLLVEWKIFLVSVHPDLFHIHELDSISLLFFLIYFYFLFFKCSLLSSWLTYGV